jgi:3-methylfumaryl-CoA hydratase
MASLTLDSLVQEDDAAWAPLARLAACHAQLAGLAAGPALPPLWHWLHFLDAAPAADLGADGHRRRGGMVPHDPALPARMWAGGRLRFGAPADAGARVRRETSVAGIHDRQGKSGALRFVTLRHVVSGSAGVLVEEEQDLVFRAPAAGRRAPPVAEPAPQGATTRVIVPDAVLLFRFSALTFNAHRIHYDVEYARSEEHYPGLVVHGPLQAFLLIALLREAAPDTALRRFEFRGQAPAFVDRALQLEAWEEGGIWRLQTRDAAGAVCMVAKAEVEKNVLF